MRASFVMAVRLPHAAAVVAIALLIRPGASVALQQQASILPLDTAAMEAKANDLKGHEGKEQQSDANQASSEHTSPTVVQDSSLPEGWKAAVDPKSGKTYYWNKADPRGTTTWVRPEVQVQETQVPQTPQSFDAALNGVSPPFWMNNTAASLGNMRLRLDDYVSRFNSAGWKEIIYSQKRLCVGDFHACYVVGFRSAVLSAVKELDIIAKSLEQGVVATVQYGQQVDASRAKSLAETGTAGNAAFAKWIAQLSHIKGYLDGSEKGLQTELALAEADRQVDLFEPQLSEFFETYATSIGAIAGSKFPVMAGKMQDNARAIAKPLVHTCRQLDQNVRMSFQTLSTNLAVPKRPKQIE